MKETREIPLLVIIGPTAVGKTALSLHLAKHLGGEVVSADSRLFYRGMDIGTAKPTPQERAEVPHHLIDIADPDDTVGLAQFKQLAEEAISHILDRARLPLLVGGTGQYVRAIIEGWSPPAVPPDSDLRAKLEKQAQSQGPQSLHNHLRELDPKAASRIDPRNVRRVIRALEVCLITGKPFSAQRTRTTPPYSMLIVGLTMDRSTLYSRVDSRVDGMMEQGLPEEVEQLVRAGYGWDLPAMSGLGYIQFRPYFEGDATLEEVAEEIKHATHSFIRRQYNWFRLSDPRITWFDVTKQSQEDVEHLVRQWLHDDAPASLR